MCCERYSSTEMRDRGAPPPPDATSGWLRTHLHIEVDGAVGLIGVSVVDDALDVLHHLRRREKRITQGGKSAHGVYNQHRNTTPTDYRRINR